MAVVYSNRGHFPERILSAILLIVLTGVAAAQAPAPERILSYDVAIKVLPDSSMNVEETIRVRAAGDEIRHGIMRDFPTEYRDSHGDRIEVGFQVEKVTRDGKIEPFSVSSLSNGKRVRIGRANVTLEPGEYTYAITYRTDHQLGFFPDHDELYWNATGFWGFEIDRATVQVTLPDGVPADQIKLQAYTGPSGSTASDYTADMTDGFPHFATTKPLATYEGITIVVGWPKGFVTPPPPRVRKLPRSLRWEDLREGDWWKIKILRDAGGFEMAGVALILLVLLIGAWMRFGRDTAGRSITVTYEPPEHLSPAAMRCARKLTFDSKAMTAAVLNLAAKKYLKVEKDGSTYVLVRTGKEADPPPSMEEDLIGQSLFTVDDKAKEAREKFEAKLPDLKKNHPLLAKLAEGIAGMVEPEDPNRVKLRHSNTRLMNAHDAAKRYLDSEFKPESLMRPHAWVITLSSILAIIGTVACVMKYPGDLSAEDGTLALAFFVMGFHVVFMLWLGGRLAKLLPVESFAPARTVGDTMGYSIGVIISAAFAIATGWMISLLTSLEFAIALSVTWLAIALFARLIKQPTQLGQQYWDEIEGFRQFLTEVDEDRLNRMNPPSKTPELFERMLPYALALDCEVVWAKKFESVLAMAATAQGGGQTYSPSWYSGPAGDMMNASAFTGAFASSFSSAIASSTTAPGSSSGFSDGGGGGSSGGGGGGGGGGGW